MYPEKRRVTAITCMDRNKEARNISNKIKGRKTKKKK